MPGQISSGKAAVLCVLSSAVIIFGVIAGGVMLGLPPIIAQAIALLTVIANIGAWSKIAR